MKTKLYFRKNKNKNDKQSVYQIIFILISKTYNIFIDLTTSQDRNNDLFVCDVIIGISFGTRKESIDPVAEAKIRRGDDGWQIHDLTKLLLEVR